MQGTQGENMLGVCAKPRAGVWLESRESQHEGRGQMGQGFIDHGKEFGDLFRCHGEPLSSFIQSSNFCFKDCSDP